MTRFLLRRLLQVTLLLGAFIAADVSVAPAACATVATAAKRKTKRRKKRPARKRKRRKPAITVVWKSADGSQWIRKGAKGIIVSKDSLGNVRAMAPFGPGHASGADYAAAINDYARILAPDSVRVYSIIAPSQGEFYMPDRIGSRGNEQRAITSLSALLDSTVTAVFVRDTLLAHADEEIYSRTDHHWAPLGAYYASAALADAAGVTFMPLDVYQTDTVRNYVGTMHRFSGDPEVLRAPENFVSFRPPGKYLAEFIDYHVTSGNTRSESPVRIADFFVSFAHGSGAAYCTFMGGDYHTVRVSETGGTPGRRLLIVKDSFGNAMAPALFGSFEEVHVIDHRYYPHNLVDYVRRYGITDLLFINSIQLVFAPTAGERLRRMLDSTSQGNEFIIHPTNLSTPDQD